jgi:hypothetical protein
LRVTAVEVRRAARRAAAPAERGARGKLKTLPPGVEESWAGVKLLDVRAKGKKDTCKVSTEVQEVLKKTRMVGVVWTKPKKKKMPGKK